MGKVGVRSCESPLLISPTSSLLHVSGYLITSGHTHIYTYTHTILISELGSKVKGRVQDWESNESRGERDEREKAELSLTRSMVRIPRCKESVPMNRAE